MKPARVDGRKTYILLALMLGFAVYPKILTFIDQATTDPFSFSSIAVAEVSYRRNEILLNPFRVADPNTLLWQSFSNHISERLLVTSFLVVFSKVTGLTLRHLQFLPLAGLIMILLGFALAKAFTKSSITAALFTLFIAYHNNEANSFFYLSGGYLMMMLFLLLFYKTIEKSISQRTGIILLVLVYVTSYLTYYTADFLNLVVVGGSALTTFLAKRTIFRRTVTLAEKLPSFFSLSLAFGAIFVMFDSAFYHFVTQGSVEQAQGVLQGYIRYVIALTKGEAAVGYVMRQGAITPVYIEAAIRIIIVFAVGVHIITHVVRSLKARRPVQITHKSMTYCLIIIASIAQVIVYLGVGFFGVSYGIMFVGLLAMYSLRSLGRGLNKERASFLICSLLVVASILRFEAIWEDPTTSYYGRYYYAAMHRTAPWLIQYVDQGIALSDHIISAQILTEATFSSKGNDVLSYRIADHLDVLYEFNQSRFDSLMGYYQWVMGLDMPNPVYLVSSCLWKDRYVVGDGWGPIGNPLGERLYFVNNYTSLNKIYSDGMGLVYAWKH
jgi:hypothetical protein